MSQYLKSRYRTHTCAELRAGDAGKQAVLSGWVLRKRDHGGVLFIDLRDNYGNTQLVISGETAKKIDTLRPESVICVHGEVKARAPEMVNQKIDTGAIELHVEKFEILGESEVLPFQIAEDDNAPEPTRLKYRFLELRREQLHKNILLRSAVIRTLREIMHSLGFVEFQTPILTSSSPEGARDFIVPSRFHPGKFFALPQAPQQFKQLLMVAGFDRYFQIAPCFRDEDPRADRSPGEFYQLDLEMSFVEQEDVFKICEEMFHGVFTKFTSNFVTPKPFPRIPYLTSMAEFGSDKPDLRNPLRISEASSVFESSEFRVFRQALDSKGSVHGIFVPDCEIPARKFFDDLIAAFQAENGFGIAYLIFDGTELRGNIAKFITADEQAALRQKFGVKEKGVYYVTAGEGDKVLPALGRLRNKLGAHYNLIEKNAFRLCWVYDYPMYERNPDTGGIDFSHNPFSMPQGGMEALTTKDPLDIFAYQYDVVCNGLELCSGAIRNHSPEIMYKAFEIAGYDREQVDQKFGGMIRAFTYGAPPHGGMAPGIDRIVMLLAGESAIRDVIAFPLAQSVEDLLMSAPSEVSEKQLREVHIQIRPEALQKKAQ